MSKSLPNLPFAVFDVFGQGCEDRVADHYRAAVAAQPEAGEAVALTDNDLERIFEVAGGKWNGDMWTIEDADFHPAMRSLLASAPTIQPTQPVQEPVISTEHGPWLPSRYHEDETYCQRCLMRDKFLGAKDCTPHIVYATPAQAGDAGEPSDGERLDYLQGTGSTVELLPPFKNGFGNFRIGGLHKAVSSDIRAAIDAAIRATKGGKL